MYSDECGSTFARRFGAISCLVAARIDLGALALVHVDLLAANVRLVGLNRAAHLGETLGLHPESDTRQHEPRGLLGHAKRPAQLVGADAIPGVREQPHCWQPLVQAKWAILEDGADLDRKLLVTRLALPNSPRANQRRLLGRAARARHAIWPAHLYDEGEAGVSVREIADRFGQRVRGGVLFQHARRIAEMTTCVKYVIAKRYAIIRRVSGRPRRARP